MASKRTMAPSKAPTLKRTSNLVNKGKIAKSHASHVLKKLTTKRGCK